MWSRSLYLLSENFNILLRLCLNVDQSWIGDVGVNGDAGIVGVQTDFGFSFDAVPMVDTILYFRV